MKIAIIPARGGSKRIPRKNIKLFHGKPMIAYSIEAAQKSGCFDKIIVSTDDQEIAEVALAYGAEVPFLRPADIADDHASTMDVMEHAIDWCKDHGLDAEFVCCIYATAPFITPASLQRGLTKMRTNKFSYAFTATTFSFPIQRAIRRSGEMFDDRNLTIRSQDLEEAFHDAGQFYWGKPDAFVCRQSVFSDDSYLILLPRTMVQDIDSEEDWLTAEVMYQVMKSSGEWQL